MDTTGSFNLGAAYASILIDESGVQKGLDSVQKQFKTFSAGLKDVGKGLLAVTTPVLAFGAVSVKAFADSQKKLAQLDAVLKSTADISGVTRDMAINLASGFQDVTEYSDETVLSGENMLLTFTNIGKDVFPTATQTMLDMSTALGQDVTQSAMQLGKALNSPIEGVGALRRVGVQLTDSQEALVKSLMAVGDTAGAQRVILNELSREFSGSAQAAGGTLTGQLTILQNKLNDVQETIGGALAPVLSDLVTTYIMPIVTSISNWVKQNPELIRQIAAVAVVGAALGGTLYILGSILPAVVSGIGLLLSPVVLLALALGALVYAGATLYPGGLSQLFADASKSAKELVDMGLIVLIDTLNKAAVSAGLLVGVVEIFLINTLHNASIAAQDLVNIFADWITKNQKTLEQLGDLGLSLLVAMGILKLYQIGVAAAALASGAGAGLAGTIAAATSAAYASVAGMVAAALPVVALTLAIYAAIEAYKKFQETVSYLGQGGVAVSNAAATAIQTQGLTHDQFMAKAFDAAVSQFGDFAARVWWDNSGRVLSEGLWQNAQHRAMGGSVNAMSPYIVGERGPELMIPSTNGAIVPNNQLSSFGQGSNGQGAGSGIVINELTIYASTKEGGAAAAKSFKEEMEETYRGRGN